MSIYLSGVGFADQVLTPSDYASHLAAVSGDGIVNGCELSAVASTLRLTAGRLVACGRMCRVPSAQDIPVTGALSGYARLLLTVDLSKTSTETSFEQARLDVEYASTEGGFSPLTQENVNDSGTVYQLVLCVMSLSTAGISGIVRSCGKAHGRAAALAVTLPAADWPGGSQTVRVDGVSADTNVVVTYAPASREAWQDAGIYLSAQGEGTLTFSCDSVPTETLTANVLLL